MYRVGIIGANLYGQIYGQAFAKQPNVELVGLTPARGDHENSVASVLGVKEFNSLTEMLDSADLDILCVCSTTADHAEHTLQAAAAGVHVLCDRPIAMDLEEARSMIDATQDANVILMIGHVLRFWPEYVRVQQILASGELGPIRSITTSRVSGTLSEPWTDRLLDPELGHGALEALIHDLDYIRWLLDAPVSTYAQGIKASSGAWGQMQSLIQMPNRIQAQVESSYLVPLNFPLSMYLRVLADKGTIVFEFRGALSSRSTSTRNLMVTRAGELPEILDASDGDAYGNLIAYFLNCVGSGKQPDLGSAEQSAQALSMLLDIVHSAAKDDIVR